ncbi:polyprenyl synthetase family protein [Staphylococcus succinus]|jgi:geranylgeranyl diphosphate synthase type II|uniref:Farnesyl diphosphate synthase n=1 Tax=Staphylococcus succinus TaxID=61015 RepID=A0A9Q6MVE3_9STAP|nr:farnesyl diphosphate synthase [Staphylococcus succinus]MEB8126637.1 polyprenyl synthetase family protein [Staphylococcus succinus]PTI37114.1 polyprenyl synthetase family protein [Staphylococcus succinus]PTI75598.1 polyprenyl synthetase family protein [Staphylococcus succinus]PTJ14904.1 polyprenyl synthetase family protein [Staphylococcus succinus]RIN27174.1 polyprenyl synthetase family protein [Staphylococcus succinus]
MNQKINHLTEEINQLLATSIEESLLDTNLEESMRYSLNAGGKRIRPVLLLLTLDMLSNDYKLGFSSALGLEMIHTYSLIHDDLPAMDDDDYRRGKLTNHKVFGEWKAILAGDALLTKAFDVIINDTTLDDTIKVKLIRRLSFSSGHLGMVGGQTLDMQSEGSAIDLTTLEQIHNAKTGALLKFAVMAAVDIAEPAALVATALEQYSEHLGLMFQIKDDLLDIYGDEQKLGKAVGSDIENDKSTYVSLLGRSGAEDKLAYHTQAAHQCLAQLPDHYNTENLEAIIQLFNNRES